MLKQKKIPTLAHIADFVFFSGRNILFFFAHLNKRIRLIKTVGSVAIIHHLACAFYLQERKKIMFSARFNLHLISGLFRTHCYRFSMEKTHIYYIWFVLFPLVKFCISRQDPSLNEIGYGNVKCCRPVV